MDWEVPLVKTPWALIGVVISPATAYEEVTAGGAFVYGDQILYSPLVDPAVGLWGYQPDDMEATGFRSVIWSELDRWGAVGG
jgi:hypothetical protein